MGDMTGMFGAPLPPSNAASPNNNLSSPPQLSCPPSPALRNGPTNQFLKQDGIPFMEPLKLEDGGKRAKVDSDSKLEIGEQPYPSPQSINGSEKQPDTVPHNSSWPPPPPL